MIEEADTLDGTPGTIVIRKYAGKTEDRLTITLHEVLSDVQHDMGLPDGGRRAGQGWGRGASAGALGRLSRTGAVRAFGWCGASGPRTSARSTSCAGTPTMSGSPSRSSASARSNRSSRSPATWSGCTAIRNSPTVAGLLAAQSIKPQARVLAESRGIACVEVDLAVLRGEREPELRLFAA